MNTFKMKSMHVAVLAGLAAIGAAGTAEAVHINPDGTGQVLVYPYYTARAGTSTLITIINSQNNTKMVKVRFLEGKNSREVLDFNLFLSPADVWTGAIVATANGARVITNDNSCVTPSDLFAETRTDGAGSALNEFKNYQYTGGFEDSSAFASLDRTREGYFEVIEMGVIDDNTIDGDAIVGATAVAVTGFIKHNSAGVPANCAALNSFDNFAGNTATTRFPNTIAGVVAVPATLTQPPRGGLAGRASLINAATGANFSYSPTAFDAWSVVQKYTESGNLSPSITEVDSGAAALIGPTSNVFTSAGIVTTVWPVATPITSGRDAMSATMMRNSVINEFILDNATASLTDWVVTFPTKRAYVNVGLLAATAPFANNFRNSTAGACDPYGAAIFNREEGIPGSSTPVPNPSPLPPGVTVAGSQLCWEANVVPFGASSLSGSTNTNPLVAALQTFVNGATTVPGSNTSLTPAGIRNTQGPNGYMFMNFNGAGQILATGAAVTTRTPLGGAAVVVPAAVYNGLPVVGFMMHNYQNAGVTSKYGGLVDHKFTRSITP